MAVHQLDNMHIISILLQTHTSTSASLVIFFRPDALPDAQLTVLLLKSLLVKQYLIFLTS